MKKQYNTAKTNILKKIFIKLCRYLNYEIVDQRNFSVPTQQKSMDENLNIQGKKSITLPLGETKILRPVKALTIIFRSCTSINMLTQSKKRLFDEEKSEYTFRSLNSIIKSIDYAKKSLPKINFEIIVIDYNSKKKDLDQISKQLSVSNYKNSIIKLDVNEFKKNISNINQKNEKITENQISNMANIHKSFITAKNQCEDLIYFVEDDYLHTKETISSINSFRTT